ncbi:hypothetical protein LEP1GSC151_1266 [Leptospira interrogans serovar Grippotyphosa str. LT2186]|uniref:Uncharacterized protein n=1 Tax=Leptospira interrogans serovar Grippotyphosa str. LT2186 TaxID=1001599 RepID=M3IDH2_LEPIR|nr:hypothetical protein LEP1GSC097_3312 [Leptospira interrogans serovar Grippotyphosa str. UI 08368]EMG13381.1 hypothetical protein LEP1GSC151_1266 [Leptospira interrogans serovar Grippotyphosa str. LT2186]
MDRKIVICGSSHILKMIYKAQIPTFFKKMNHGFFYKLKLNYIGRNNSQINSHSTSKSNN